VETASKVLEDNAKTRDTTIFLQHTLDDRQNELDTLLKSVTTLLSVEGESLSRTVLAEMQTFVRTVGTLGVAGIAFSLVVGWLIRRSIVAPLDVLVGAAKRVSAKDLTQGSALRSLAKRRDEFGDLGGTFLSMEDSLREMIRGLKEGIRNLSKNSAAIAEAAQQGAATASEQASTVAQVTVTTEELLQTSKAATTSASEVAASSDKAAERGRSGQDAVLEASRIVLALNERVSEIASRIMDLGEQSKQIGGIIDTVNALAEQSSLLAVNASIEASKAGEQGRGFAVVAVEVRRLAEQSKRATNQIRTILGDTQQATNTAIMAAEEGNKQADRARDTIEPMRELVERLATILDENADRARHIVGSSSEQAAGVEQIAGAMESVSQASSHSSDGARDLERSAVALSELSTDLERLISGYRLG
jgi:methyl-accepting chemotaxis protein